MPMKAAKAAINNTMVLDSIVEMNAAFGGEVTTLPEKAFRLILENQFPIGTKEAKDDPAIMADVKADGLIAMTTRVAIVFENKTTEQSDLTLEFEVSGYCNEERDAYTIPYYMLLRLATINSDERPKKHTHRVYLITQYRKD